jgi:hypothetical protein
MEEYHAEFKVGEEIGVGDDEMTVLLRQEAAVRNGQGPFLTDWVLDAWNHAIRKARDDRQGPFGILHRQWSLGTTKRTQPPATPDFGHRVWKPDVPMADTELHDLARRRVPRVLLDMLGNLLRGAQHPIDRVAVLFRCMHDVFHW